MAMQTIQIGDRVRVCKITGIGNEPLDELESYFAKYYMGKEGVVTEADGVLYHVKLDIDDSPHPVVFMYDEIETIHSPIREGGEITRMAFITDKYILGRKDLSVYEKLAYFVIKEEDPADTDKLCEYLSGTPQFIRTVCNKLVEHGLITEGKETSGIFHVNFSITPPKKTEKKVEDKTAESQQDKDLLLLMSVLQEFYKQKGANHPISKKGRKQLQKAVYYLEGQWKKRTDQLELQQFELKKDLYQAYIEYTFKDVPKEDMNQLKRLTYAGTKRGWKAWLTKPGYRFTPLLLDKVTNADKFFGVKKSEIPSVAKLPKSGYWYTYKVFLNQRWDSGEYPIAKQVLFALEMCIVFMMFRKVGIEGVELSRLMSQHGKYTREYTNAKACDSLDDLAAYVKENKLASNLCHNCTLKSKCPTYKTSAVVVNCSQRKE